MTQQQRQQILDATDRFARHLEQMRRLAAAMQQLRREIAA